MAPARRRGRSLGWKELGGVVAVCVALLFITSTLTPQRIGKEWHTSNFISPAKKEMETHVTIFAAMDSSPTHETDDADSSSEPVTPTEPVTLSEKVTEAAVQMPDIQHKMEHLDLPSDVHDLPPAVKHEVKKEIPVQKKAKTETSEDVYQINSERNPFLGDENVADASFEVLYNSRLAAIEASICAKCEDVTCTGRCQFQEELMHRLNTTSAMNDADPRLFVIPIDPLVWFRNNADQATDYQSALQAFVRRVKSAYHYRTFKGSDHVFLCVSNGCRELGQELAEAISETLGSRAIFAAREVDGNEIDWPCPLRVISLDTGDSNDVATVVQKVVKRATFMIEKRNRWICADQDHPANHWDGIIEKEKLAGAYMRKYGFSICSIPKCGSSMTGVLLRRMLGYKNWNQTGTGINHGPKSGIKYVSHIKDGDEKKAINKDTSFVRAVIVRHPMSRLLSGYLDKIYQKRQFNRVPGLKQCIKQSKGKELSFALFVNCLIRKHPNPNKLDHHFRIQSSFCNMRHNELDFVGKQSTLAKDMMEFGQSLLFWEEYGAHGWGHYGEHAFGEKSDQARTHNSSSQVEKYYTPDLARKVYKYYQEDFIRFGYTVEEALPAISPTVSRKA